MTKHKTQSREEVKSLSPKGESIPDTQSQDEVKSELGKSCKNQHPDIQSRQTKPISPLKLQISDENRYDGMRKDKTGDTSKSEIDEIYEKCFGDIEDNWGLREAISLGIKKGFSDGQQDVIDALKLVNENDMCYEKGKSEMLKEVMEKIDLYGINLKDKDAKYLLKELKATLERLK